MGFNFGMQYNSGINLEVLYKTFLEKQLWAIYLVLIKDNLSF